MYKLSDDDDLLEPNIESEQNCSDKGSQCTDKFSRHSRDSSSKEENEELEQDEGDDIDDIGEDLEGDLLAGDSQSLVDEEKGDEDIVLSEKDDITDAGV